MPGKSPEHPVVHECSPECCPTNEIPARTARGYSIAACSPANDQEPAEPGKVGCKHNQDTPLILQTIKLYHTIYHPQALFRNTHNQSYRL